MSEFRYSRDRSRSPVHKYKPPRKFHKVDQGEPELTLYIANIPSYWKHWDIKKFLKHNVDSKATATGDLFVTTVNANTPGQSTSRCFVEFPDYESARTAQSQLDGVMCEGRKLIVNFDVEGRLKGELRDDVTDTRKQRVHEKHADRPTHPVRKNNTILHKFTNDEDKKNTYGLSMEFLNSLGVSLPLMNRLFIVNLDFKVDEAKLKEVFSLAGNVLSVNIVRTPEGVSKGLAQVEYDHPVEAVQAISMFNFQRLFDRNMSVRFDTSEEKTLPYGLESIGLGLGPNGKPLKGVRTYVELQPLTKAIKHLEDSIVNTDAEPHEQTQDNLPDYSQPQMMTNPAVNNMAAPANAMSVNLMAHANPVGVEVAQNTAETANNVWIPNNVAMNAMATFNPSTVLNPAATTPNIWNMNAIPNAVGFNQVLAGGNVNNQNMQLLQALMQAQQVQGVQTNLASLTTLGNQAVVSNMMGFPQIQPIQPINTSAVKPMGSLGNDNEINRDHINQEMQKDNIAVEQKPAASDMVVLTNLPPSVTIAILRDKMREVGEVRMAEMTSQDTAIVRFVNSLEAERCVTNNGQRKKAQYKEQIKKRSKYKI